MRHAPKSHFCAILPPHILRRIVEYGTPAQKERAFQTLISSENARGHRDAVRRFMPAGLVVSTTKKRTIYDEKGSTQLPGREVRSEGQGKAKDRAVNEAYEGSGATYDFFKEVYGRNSVDDKGLKLDSSVHYSRQYDNAFWNGEQMVYGDGDGDLFNRFTAALDVIGHELTHGVTQYEAGLMYQGQSGALNESMSDVFGSLVRQWKEKKKASQADWLIGKGLFSGKVQGRGLRSMAAPGTAYDDPVLGRDPQPSHMRRYYGGNDDNGGVHINSGIPNHAFYVAAMGAGGYAWEKVGKVWYAALKYRLRESSGFSDAANHTIAVAGVLFGADGKVQKAVRDGWKKVGVVR